MITVPSSLLRRTLFVTLIACSPQIRGADWYVAPNGNDAWTGQLPSPNAAGTDGPFAMLSKAREVIRTGSGVRTVNLRAGIYELPQGLKFDAGDSGREDAPVTWQAYQNEK